MSVVQRYRTFPATWAGRMSAPSAEEIMTYCRLSQRATLMCFALTYVLGFHRVRVYGGSWTEWRSIVGFPIAKV
jgi:thiosulfate/3-mercaptopyruvate sulfurtransferase